MKICFVCLESSADVILQDDTVMALVPDIGSYNLACDPPLGDDVGAMAQRIADLVNDDWASKRHLASPQLLTILGRTQHESFFLIQRLFESQDVPALRAYLRLPISASRSDNVHEVFSYALKEKFLSYGNIDRLEEAVLYTGSDGPRGEAQRRYIKVYAEKWLRRRSRQEMERLMQRFRSIHDICKSDLKQLKAYRESKEVSLKLNVMAIGNPGVGKSFILNAIIGKVAFQSGFE